jgi:hypothetical protein
MFQLPMISQFLSMPWLLKSELFRTSQGKRIPACGLQPLSNYRKHPFCTSNSQKKPGTIAGFIDNSILLRTKKPGPEQPG